MAVSKKLSKSQISAPKLFQTSLVYQTKEFFNNSTLHGVRYIAENGRPFGEKFMWFCFVLIGVIAALIIIFSLWEKFQTNPTITGLDTDFHNQQVIFPSVVVCPFDPYDEEKVVDYAYKTLGAYEAGSERFEPFLKILTQLSYARMSEALEISLNLTEDAKTLKSKSLRRLAFAVAISCDQVFKTCRYKDDEIKCCEHFLPIYIEHGFCYAFNTRYKDSADNEERSNQAHDMYETDKKWALNFVLEKKSMVYIHAYDESPGFDYRPQFTWNINDEVDILISMKQTYTTDDARQLTIGQRKCIFPNEKKLKYYNDDYTFSGCMRQCRIQKCITYCKCVPPFYRIASSEPHCTVQEISCLAKHMENITNINGCIDCELSCQNVVYDIEKLSKVSQEQPAEKADTVINIEYLTWPIVRYKREVLFGWVDLLVSFGGIAGLFLGFSLLSGVEIIYYFTLRACCMVYKNRDDLQKIEEEKMMKSLQRFDLSLIPSTTQSKLTRRKSLPTVLIVEETKTNYEVDKNYTKKRNGVIKISFNPPNFKPVKVAPYQSYPLNKKFRSNSTDQPFYYGYMP